MWPFKKPEKQWFFETTIKLNEKTAQWRVNICYYYMPHRTYHSCAMTYQLKDGKFWYYGKQLEGENFDTHEAALDFAEGYGPKLQEWKAAMDILKSKNITVRWP